MRSWEETSLWSTLRSHRDSPDRAVGAMLEVVMPKIEGVVGDQSPKDFTLHDGEHAWRVAQLMVEVMSEEVSEQLSAFELALLLASAYLHDIGMSPQIDLVERHRDFLAGEGDLLSDEDRGLFQAWLDREHDGIEPPVENRAEADFLLMHYVRDRHVAWGERWIRSEIADLLAVPDYEDFAEDLIRLCRSHHQGYPDLVSEEFEPRFLRLGKAVVHRRYLACVLRIADVLDVDPERTPPILFNHRKVAEESAIYWHKDHEMDLSVEADGRVLVEAEPSTAPLYRAVEETAEGIESELRLCRDVDATHPFEVAPGRPARSLPHRWKLEPIVYRRIRPRENRFVYVDGAFRPDATRLLELLGGRQLYGDSELAIRELLQNAYDAVRERIAWQRLALSRPQNEAAVEALVDKHRVELLIEDRDGARWLVCRDTGAGMTRETLVNYLLVSGAGRNPDSLDLKRRGREAGIEVERTGMFGIGVLSYFMLADRLELKTRRCPEAPTGEAKGWAFGTDGVGSFGELVRDGEWREGTEVSLRLTATLSEKRLAELLESLVIHAPCPTVVAAGGGQRLRLPARWKTGPEGFLDLARKRLENSARSEEEDDDFVPGDRREERERGLRALDAALEALDRSIHWKILEGDLDEDLGRYRIAVPYFDTPAGIALAIVNVAEHEGGWLLAGIGHDRIATFDFPLIQSVGGMRIAEPRGRFSHPLRSFPWIGYVDWRPPAAGRILASRNEIRLSRKAEGALGKLQERAAEAISELLEQQPQSPLRRINARLAERAGVKAPAGLESSSWLAWKRAEEGGWWPQLEELKPPIVEARGSTGRSLRVGSERISVPGYIANEWESSWQPPAKFVLDLDRSHLVGYWPDLTLRDMNGRYTFPEFPPGSEGVAALAFGYGSFAWNLRCPICSGAWVRDPRTEQKKELDLPAVREEALRSPTEARRWLFELLMRYERYRSFEGPPVRDLWEALTEEEPDFTETILRIALGEGGPQKLLLVDYSYGGSGRRTLTFSVDGIRETEEEDLGEEILRLWSQPGWYVEED